MYTTAVLAEHFKVSPENIRRILKSKWQPSEEQAERRRQGWEKRGEKKWTEMATLGIRPPKRWREKGAGRAPDGGAPLWKKGSKEKTVGGERWIHQSDTEPFLAAADRIAEEQTPSVSIAERIL